MQNLAFTFVLCLLSEFHCTYLEYNGLKWSWQTPALTVTDGETLDDISVIVCPLAGHMLRVLCQSEAPLLLKTTLPSNV